MLGGFMAEIYLAGGCFWGVKGCSHCCMQMEDLGYQLSRKSGATDAETVHANYDQSVVSLYDILGITLELVTSQSQGQQSVDSISTVSITNELIWPVVGRIMSEAESLFGQKLCR